MRRNTWLIAGKGLLELVVTLLLIAACQTPPNQIFIEVDGNRQSLTTQAATVREALTEAKIELGQLDRVKPDLYTQLEPGLVITITRVKEEIEVKREIIPFERQTVVNEALGRGETRLSQLGVNGEEEVSTRVVYENGVEVSRTEVSRTTLTPPSPEILVIGPQNELPSTPVEGTVAYISNGNAWLMRDSSGSRHPLTTTGDLDGRVFSLSPDGRRLLFTRALTNAINTPLNEAWLASTTIVGEKPITIGLQGVLFAAWSPVVTSSLLAYSTAERTPNPPGWRANNDLWLLSPVVASEGSKSAATAKPLKVLPANTQGLYPWWGTTFAWSPDGTRLAYARADQIGVVELKEGQPISHTVRPLVDFVPLKTFSEWVWVPGLSWSPDGQFIAVTVHGPSLAAEPAEESQVFDLWLIGVDNGLKAKVAKQVGMWANPAWGQAGIVFGKAGTPLQSVNSRYYILLIDRDGSNKRQIFPFQEELGVQLPELIWSAQNKTLLFVYNGNLYMIDIQGGPPRQLTTDGQSSHPQWVAAAPLEVRTISTATAPLTVSTAMSVTPDISVTAPVSREGTVTLPTPVTTTPTITLTSTRSPVTTPEQNLPHPANPVTTTFTQTITITPTLNSGENGGIN